MLVYNPPKCSKIGYYSRLQKQIATPIYPFKNIKLLQIILYNDLLYYLSKTIPRSKQSEQIFIND